jgi:ubiquinone/menaquinone biosynthesis C-methylase UbiE
MVYQDKHKYLPLRVAIFLVLTGALVTFGRAQGSQAESPKITERARELNESFADPDVQQWVERFEREGRDSYAKRFEILDLMNLKPGMNVADIGAGSGFFSRLMAQKVAPSGIVYAVDISSSFVEHSAKTAREMGLENVKAVLGDPRSPKLPENSVDVVFISHSYHHFEYPYEMLAEIKKALRPDGLFLLVDAERITGLTSEGRMRMVRAGKGTFTDEIINAGFELEEEIDLFELDYVLKFRHRHVQETADAM